MKKWILLIVVLFLICGCSGKGNNLDSVDPSFAIKISGSNNMRFRGCYAIYTSKGESESISVDGVVPKECFLTGRTITCWFQKQSDSGTLRVEIFKNSHLYGEGKIVAQAETSGSYGVIMLTVL